MTSNYLNQSNQGIPAVNDFQGMSEPKKTLRTRLRSVKRILNRTNDTPKLAVDYSELIVEAGPIRKASIDVQGEMVIRTANSLLGLAIVTHVGSIGLGEVRDLIFCHETNEVLALVVEDQSGEVGKTQIVPWSEICSVEKERITVYRVTSRMSLSDYPRALHAANNKSRLADMCIDEASGCIVGYGNTEGFIANS